MANETDQPEAWSENPINALKIDESMKLLFTVDNEALVLFVNNAFHRQHDLKESKLIFLASEFISEDVEKIQADLMFMINEYKYHLEFQTKFAKTMIIRMVEYGLSKIKETKAANNISDDIILEFPMPLVIQVEQNDNSQDEINAFIKISGSPDTLNFKIPVINMWKYELDDVIRRKWYLLIPYCLMKYRKLLKPGQVTSNQKDKFTAEMKNIMEKVHELYRDNKISSTFYPPLMKMIILISNHINEKFIHDNEIRKELTKMNSSLNPLGSTTIQKYLDQGVNKGKKEVAVKMLKRGRLISEIIEDTDFSEDVIKELAKEFGLEVNFTRGINENK